MPRIRANRDDLIRLLKEQEQFRAEQLEDAPSRLLGVADIARLLNVKKATIYYWIHKGIIPHVKLPGAVRFELGKIMGWIAVRRKGYHPPPSAAEIATRIFKNRP